MNDGRRLIALGRFLCAFCLLMLPMAGALASRHINEATRLSAELPGPGTWSGGLWYLAAFACGLLLPRFAVEGGGAAIPRLGVAVVGTAMAGIGWAAVNLVSAVDPGEFSTALLIGATMLFAFFVLGQVAFVLFGQDGTRQRLERATPLPHTITTRIYGVLLSGLSWSVYRHTFEQRYGETLFTIWVLDSAALQLLLWSLGIGGILMTVRPSGSFGAAVVRVVGGIEGVCALWLTCAAYRIYHETVALFGGVDGQLPFTVWAQIFAIVAVSIAPAVFTWVLGSEIAAERG